MPPHAPRGGSWQPTCRVLSPTCSPEGGDKCVVLRVTRVRLLNGLAAPERIRPLSRRRVAFLRHCARFSCCVVPVTAWRTLNTFFRILPPNPQTRVFAPHPSFQAKSNKVAAAQTDHRKPARHRWILTGRAPSPPRRRRRCVGCEAVFSRGLATRAARRTRADGCRAGTARPAPARR